MYMGWNQLELLHQGMLGLGLKSSDPGGGTGMQDDDQLLNFKVSGTAESHRTCANSSDQRSQLDSYCTGARSVEEPVTRRL
eukprot:2314916-Rhodomonas_salina.1